MFIAKSIISAVHQSLQDILKSQFQFFCRPHQTAIFHHYPDQCSFRGHMPLQNYTQWDI